MHRICLKDSLTGEFRGTNSEKEARRLIVTGGSDPSTWARKAGRKDSSPYVEPKKATKKKANKK